MRETKKTAHSGAALLILLAGAYYAGWHYKNHKYDAFAQCLATKQAKMYGLYWCPHCIEQKEMFGESFHYVPYVECGIKGSKEMKRRNAKWRESSCFPVGSLAWISPKKEFLSLQALSDKTGCSLP